MKIEISTLYWTNTDPRMVRAHQQVINHFDLDVNYYEENTQHGLWMDRVCAATSADVIGFFDADCVPLSRERVDEAVDYVSRNDTFLGVAQVANYIKPATHIYAAPAFFFITKTCWQRLQASFLESKRCDVGEALTYSAEEKQQRFRCLYPVAFEAEPVGGIWPLNHYGFFGIGTVFDNACYHLYQGRMNNNVERFQRRCQEIVDGTFSTQGFVSATDFNYKGNIWPV